MPIIQTISSAYQFSSAFDAAGRGNQFSFEALESIFDYYNEFYENVELDVIAICCEWVEMSTDDVIKAYGIEYDEYENGIEGEDTDTKNQAAKDYLEKNTTVFQLSDQSTFVFIQF